MALHWQSKRRLRGPITSTKNDLVKEVVRLHRSRDRRASGLILLEGPQLVEEAVRADVEVEYGLTTDTRFYPDAIEVTAEVLAKVSSTESPNQVLMVARQPTRGTDSGSGAALLVLWNISDPGNVGALIRSAAAFGFEVVVAGGEAADPWSPKALRAGAGGHFHTAVRVEWNLSIGELRERGYTTVATVARAGHGLPRVDGPVALLVGSEAHGLPAEAIDAADVRWTIPIEDVESLNASVAGSIAMYEMAKGRDAGVEKPDG